MRKIFSFLMSVAVAATTFVGCTNTEINIDSTPTPTPTGTYRQLTFSTEQDASRTHHNGETIIWSKGDKIRIGYTKDGVWQNAKGDSSAAKLYASNELGSDCEYSKFTLTTRFKDTDATGPIIFYGLYPSNITKRNEQDLADSAEGTINVVLPQIQSPAATSFDSNADLMVSQSVKTYEALPTYEEHISMRWTRLVTHGMITLKNLTDEDGEGMTADEKVQYVIIEADADDALTGEFTLDIDGKTLTPIVGKSKNKVRLSYADTDYNTLTDADEDGAADDFVVWFATAPFEATSLTITVGTDKATYTREITSANKTFVVNKRNKLGINMASATRVEIETEDNWMMVQDADKFADGITIIIAKMYGNGDEPAMNINGTTTKISVSKKTDGSGSIYSATNVGEDIQQFKLGVNPEASGQYSFQALNGDNTGQYLWTRATTKNGDLYYVQEEKFWEVDTGAFDGGSTQLGKGGVVPVGNSVSVSLAYYNSAFCVRNSFNVDGVSPITLYYNATALPSLSAPVIDSDKDKTKQTDEGNAVQVVWSEVENALSYTITATCEGKEDIVVKNITDTTYTVDGFVEGTWTITVTAEADNYKSATSAGVDVEVIDQTPRITVEPTELAFTSAGDTKSITVETAYFGANVEISAESSNNAFSVSVDGTTKTVSVTAEANETDAAIGGTITVTATDGATTLTADVTVQQAAPLAATGWTLLTDVNTLKPGMEVVITANTANRVLGALSDEFFTAVSGVTFSDDKSTITALPADAIIFTIGGTTDAYTFSCDSGLLGSSSATKNQWNGNNTTWTLTPNDGNVDIISVGTDGQLQYNTAAPRFRNYTSSQGEVQIYYRGEGSGEFPITPSLTVTPTSLTWEADATEAQQITVTANGEWSHGESGMDWATVSVSDNVITVTPKAANSNEAANEGTITISMAGVDNVVVNCSQAGATQSGGDDTGSTEQWARVTSLNDITAGTYAIICGDFILLNNSGSSRQAVTTYASKGITITNNTIASVPTECQWAFAGNNTAMTLSPVDDATKYLYSTKSGDGLRISTTHDTWSFSTGATANYFYIKDANKSVHLAVYNNQDWRSYTSATQAQSNMQLYKKTGGNSGGDTPATPTQLTMSSVSCTEQTENSLTFSWSAVEDATGYQVSTDNSNWISPNGNLSHTLSGLTADTQYTLYVKAIGDGVNYTNSAAVSAQGTTSVASGGGAKTYSFTILPSSFNSTSYAANNNSKTSTATATDGSTMQVSWTSNQVMLQSGVMQWQKSKGYIYNTTDLGTIKSITVNSSAGTFTQYINSSQKPTSNGTGGYFQIKVGSATGNVSSIEVTFEK